MNQETIYMKQNEEGVYVIDRNPKKVKENVKNLMTILFGSDEDEERIRKKLNEYND